MRIALLLTLLFSGAQLARAEQVRSPGDASEYPAVDLVTMGVGALIWEKHGHIALCVRYESPRDDTCYNYGVAEFQKPFSMGWGFMRGHDSFWVAPSSPQSLLNIYLRADRTVYVQRLPLDRDQVDKLIAKLEFDVRPENRRYSYDHFWDNCTTRVRDIINDVTGGVLAELGKRDTGLSIRTLAREGFYRNPIALNITDVFMGRPTDVEATYYDAMFLPKYMRAAVEEAYGVRPEVIYQRKGPPHPTDSPSGRFAFAVFILVMTLPAWATRLAGRFQRIGLGLAVFIPGLVGLALWFVVVASPVPYVRWNELVFLLVPFDLALPFLAATARQKYARFRVAMLLAYSLLLVIGVMKQPLHVAVFWPLIINLVAAFPGAPRPAESTDASHEPSV